MDKSDQRKPAAKRRRGVNQLIGRGWMKSRIAKDTSISMENLRVLLTDGRGQRSPQGLVLDNYLKKHGAFDESIQYGPDEAIEHNVIARESSSVYSIRREINIPSPQQLEDARLVARATKNKAALEEIEEIADIILGLRMESDELEIRFDSVRNDLRIFSRPYTKESNSCNSE